MSLLQSEVDVIYCITDNPVRVRVHLDSRLSYNTYHEAGQVHDFPDINRCAAQLH